MYRFKKRKRTNGVRFSSPKEIRKEFVAIPKNYEGNIEQTGLPVASDKKHVYLDTNVSNNLIVGTAHSGKTQLFGLPMVKMMANSKEKPSFIFIDPHDEVIHEMYEYLMMHGYKIIYWNTDDRLCSLGLQGVGYNILSVLAKCYAKEIPTGGLSETLDLVKNLAESLTANDKCDPVWSKCAKALLSAIILYVMQKLYGKDRLDLFIMPNVYTFFLEYGSKNYTDASGQQRNALDDIFATLSVNDPAKILYDNSRFADSEMRSSVFAVLSSNLNIFSDVGIEMLSSCNLFEFSELVNPEQPIAFIFCGSYYKRNHTFESIVFEQCYSELIRAAQESSGHKLSRKVYIFCDEFAEAFMIPRLADKLETCNKYNISFNILIMSFSFFYRKYNENETKRIMESFDNIVYLQSMDQDTIKEISERLGKISHENRLEYLLSPFEITRLSLWHIIILRKHGKLPILSELPPAFSIGIGYEEFMPRPKICTESMDTEKAYNMFREFLKIMDNEKVSTTCVLSSSYKRSGEN